IRVAPHERFQRRADDLLTTLSVPITQAALGGSVDIETFDSPATVTIPPGTQPGKVMRLKGRGVPHLGRSGRGARLAEVRAQGAVVLGGADARHLAVVRRAAPGDAVRVSDGQGRVVEARLVSVTPSRVEAAIVSESRLPPPRPVVEVYQGLAKGDKVDGVVR